VNNLGRVMLSPKRAAEAANPRSGVPASAGADLGGGPTGRCRP